MRKVLSILLLAALVAFCRQGLYAQETVKAFSVYADSKSPDNHYIPSGWMGDARDISMDDKYMGEPHGGSTCIKFIYTAERSGGQGWAGVYWQNPANNWGSRKGGFDLTGLNKLTFWARGEKGGEIIDKFSVGGLKGTYPDTTEMSVGPFELTSTWQQYTINLTGKDLSYIVGGFCWVANADSNPDGLTFYMDDIRFGADAALKPEVKKAESVPFYVYADKGGLVNHFTPSGWMGDYSDLKINIGSLENPYFGETCIKIAYSNDASNGARWAGIYWQNPANNWGGVDAGFDLSRAKKLTFWARGEKGGERIEEAKVGGIMGEYSDSDAAGIGPIVLDKEWQQYTIDLAGKDMSYIIGGLAVTTNLDVNPDGATFYLDEIRYE